MIAWQRLRSPGCWGILLFMAAASGTSWDLRWGTGADSSDLTPDQQRLLLGCLRDLGLIPPSGDAVSWPNLTLTRPLTATDVFMLQLCGFTFHAPPVERPIATPRDRAREDPASLITDAEVVDGEFWDSTGSTGQSTIPEQVVVRQSARVDSETDPAPERTPPTVQPAQPAGATPTQEAEPEQSSRWPAIVGVGATVLVIGAATYGFVKMQRRIAALERGASDDLRALNEVRHVDASEAAGIVADEYKRADAVVDSELQAVRESAARKR